MVGFSTSAVNSRQVGIYISSIEFMQMSFSLSQLNSDVFC